MGAMKLDLDGLLFYPPDLIDRQFADAFGPRPELFQRTNLFGWRQMFARPGCPSRTTSPKHGQSDVHTLIRAHHLLSSPVGS